MVKKFFRRAESLSLVLNRDRKECLSLLILVDIP